MLGATLGNTDTWSLISWGFGSLAVYIVLWWFFLDPLATIPGPWYARISSLWLAAQCRRGQRSKAVHELHKKYGDTVRIAQNHISISSVDALNDIFVHDKFYVKGPWYATFRTPDPHTTGLVALESVDIHREMRGDLAPAFSARALREFEPRMSKHHLRFRQQISSQFAGVSAAQVDLSDWVNLLAFDAIAEFSFGKPFGFIENGRDSEGLMKALEMRGMVANTLGVLPLWLRPYMPWIPFDKFWKASAQSIFTIRKLSETSTTERLQTDDPELKDLLSYMLQAKSEGGNPWPMARIYNQATQTVIAGSDSTAASTIHFIDYVSRRPDLQRQLQKEIDEIFPGAMDDDWVPSDVDTAKLSFSKAVLYEILRLCPTSATGFERVVIKPGAFLGGYQIPIGTCVSVPTWSLHRNPTVYSDPETFDPERWLGKDAAANRQNWNVFSVGPRNCIGKTFAMMEMMKTITLLLKLFNIERAIDDEAEMVEGFFLKAKECRVQLKMR